MRRSRHVATRGTVSLALLVGMGVALVGASSAEARPAKKSVTVVTTKKLAASEPETPVRRIKVMVPDVKSATDAVGSSDVETISALLVFQLGKVPQFDVISSREIRQMLALETEKQLLGCDGETSCLSEIADALDAELIVNGLVSQLGGRRVLQISVIDTTSASVKGRAQFEIRQLGELPDALRGELDTLCKEWGGIEGVTKQQPNTSFGRQVANIANRPDTSMLMLQLLVGGSAILAPVFPFVPVLQAFTFLLLGEDVAGRNYPNWWWPMWAGYLAYGLSFLGGVAVIAATSNLIGVNAAVSSGVAAFFAGVFLLEPLVAWGSGIVGAEDSLAPGLEPTIVDDGEVAAPGSESGESGDASTEGAAGEEDMPDEAEPLSRLNFRGFNLGGSSGGPFVAPTAAY